MDWQNMTASDLGRAIGEGKLDARELTEGFLDAIEAHPEKDRIYARTTPDRARAEAKAAAEKDKKSEKKDKDEESEGSSS